MDETDLFYIPKHFCVNYKGNFKGLFKLIRLEEGCMRSFDTGKPDYFLFFVLEGQLEVTDPDCRRWSVREKEMFLLTNHYSIRCITPVTLIFFLSDYPGRNESKILHRLTSICEKLDRTYIALEFCKPLVLFLDLLKCYLVDQALCIHLHEQKQEELFIVLDTFYTVEELACLFYPIVINKDRRFSELVLNHCLQARTVTELILLCDCDANYFRNKFKEIFNRPIYQWMQMQRAEQVRDRLQNVNVNLKELMHELGFETASHFNKFCQKWLNMSPSHYIKAMEVKNREKDVKICNRLS